MFYIPNIPREPSSVPVSDLFSHPSFLLSFLVLLLSLPWCTLLPSSIPSFFSSARGDGLIATRLCLAEPRRHLPSPGTTSWDQLLPTAYLSAWSSCPWAIYRPEWGTSKEGKENTECCWWTTLFLLSFFCFCPFLSALGSFVSIKNETAPIYVCHSRVSLLSSFFLYNPPPLLPLAPKPPPQTSVQLCRSQRSSLLGHTDEESGCPLFLSSSSSSSSLAFLHLQYDFSGGVSITKSFNTAEEAVVTRWRGEARDQLEIDTTPDLWSYKRKEKKTH